MSFPIRPAKAGENDTYVNYPLQAGAVFQNGAAVVLVAGEVAECGADPALILGFATSDATGAQSYAWMADTRGEVVPQVPIALANQEFRGVLDGVFAAADVGSQFGLVFDAPSGFWVVDKADVVNTRVLVTGVDDGVQVGDVDVACTFVVLPANRQVAL